MCFLVAVWSRSCLCMSVRACSYKEESDDSTNSDDLIEVEMTEADHEREAAETIEKVVRHRVGRKGGTLLASCAF